MNVFIFQTQGCHLPLRLLRGRLLPGSHPAHLPVRLHRVLRLQLQHRPDGAVRPAVWFPSIPLRWSFPCCNWIQHIAERTIETFALDQFDSPNCILLFNQFHFILLVSKQPFWKCNICMEYIICSCCIAIFNIQCWNQLPRCCTRSQICKLLL